MAVPPSFFLQQLSATKNARTCNNKRQRKLPRARHSVHENGVKKEEVVEGIKHLGFYSGWSTAASALAIAKAVLANAPEHGARS